MPASISTPEPSSSTSAIPRHGPLREEPWVFNSWAVFGTGAGILVGLNLVGGNIRLGGGHRLAGSRR